MCPVDPFDDAALAGTGTYVWKKCSTSLSVVIRMGKVTLQFPPLRRWRFVGRRSTSLLDFLVLPLLPLLYFLWYIGRSRCVEIASEASISKGRK